MPGGWAALIPGLGFLCLSALLPARPALAQRIVVLDGDEDDATGESADQDRSGPVRITIHPDSGGVTIEARGSRDTADITRGHDRVSFGGEVVVPEGTVVSGDAVCIMGSVRVDGTVRGDAVAIGGNLRVGPKGVVRGEGVSLGGHIDQAPGGQIGERVEISFMPRIGRGPGFFLTSGMFGFFAHLFLVGLVGWILMRVAGTRWAVALATLRSRAGGSLLAGLGAGIIYWILVVPIMVAIALLLLVTVLGIPLVPVVLLFLILLPVMGYAVTAALLGRAVHSGSESPGGDMPARTLGGSYLIGHVLFSLPWLLAVVLRLAVGGWMGIGLPFLLIAWGLILTAVAFGWGAILLSRFGRRLPGAAPPTAPTAPAGGDASSALPVIMAS